MAVTLVRARDANCCALAAIESLSADRGDRRYSQTDLIKEFPDHTRKGKTNAEGHSIQGVIGPLDTLHILRSLGFAAEFVLGLGKDFAELYQSRIPNGVFLLTMNYPDGKYGYFHCWRIESTGPSHCSVVNNHPNPEESPLPVIPLSWDQVHTLGGNILVCVHQ
jgi:hypothetical protein